MKKSSKEWSLSSHKGDKDKISGSPSDNGVFSDEGPSDEEDDHKWSGRSASEEVSEDEFDRDSD